MSIVYLVGDDGATTPMERVICQNEDRELQRILELNPNLLPGEQIDPEDPRRWLLIEREMPVPDPGTGSDRWSVDFLFADQDAVPTFVECKRCTDTRARREIVGQMLKYAANGHHYWTKDDLRERATQRAIAANRTIEDSLRSLGATDDLSVEEYFERVQLNLREGQLRVIFFLEDSSQELRSVVDFLNRQMERSEVLLVEARQYFLGSAKVVTPMLFGYTEEARLVKRTVTVTSSASRKRWDRKSFFADAQEKLTPDQLEAVTALLDHCVSEGCEITWGTGARRGSFNVKDTLICPRSLLTCFSNGDLILNLFWLNGSDLALRAQNLLRQLAQTRLGLPPGKEDHQISIGAWILNAQTVGSVLGQVLSDCRAAAVANPKTDT